jgi:hypothetical protein
MLDMIYDPPERNPGKPWKWILVDSAIIAALAALAVLPPDRPPTTNELYICVKTFVNAFIFQVALERGLKPYVYKKRRNNSSNGGG